MYLEAVHPFSCGVKAFAGFGALYPQHYEQLERSVAHAKRYNKLCICVIKDTQLHNNPELVAALKKHGFVQAHRWENRVHPGPTGGSMMNLFITQPVKQVADNHTDPADYNWMDKRRKS